MVKEVGVGGEEARHVQGKTLPEGLVGGDGGGIDADSDPEGGDQEENEDDDDEDDDEEEEDDDDQADRSLDSGKKRQRSDKGAASAQRNRSKRRKKEANPFIDDTAEVQESEEDDEDDDAGDDDELLDDELHATATELQQAKKDAAARAEIHRKQRQTDERELNAEEIEQYYRNMCASAKSGCVLCSCASLAADVCMR
jgi:hypothetical protein